ncbi:O-antigen ligase family protein [Actinomadura harenae]|uniref:O-antigen ligase domain-containing protein n=1 Tax=Actinomadura harenae TaxID=2483351 RepID=A0A3M2LRV9_9ACTN|nr:O-antigen ligase family protein [Actinomadura harenae]RMI39630.1 O-antigen ligase domain-containing protein [Actinomadura harenae]
MTGTRSAPGGRRRLTRSSSPSWQALPARDGEPHSWGSAWWRRPSWLVAATVLSVAIPLGDDSVASGTTHASPGDAVSLVLVVIAGALWMRGRVRVPVAVTLVIAGVVVAAALSTEFSPEPATSLVGWVRQTQVFVLVPLAVMVAVRDRRDVSVVVGSVVALGTVEALVGVWQTVTHDGASYAGKLIRAVGTFGALDVMAMATVCGMALVMAVSLALTARDGRRRALLLGVVAVLAAGLACSLSRGSWIAALAGLLVVLVRFDVKLAFRLGLCALALATVVVGGFGIGSGTIGTRTRSILDSVNDPDRSVGDRYALWGTAEGMWQDHPVTGVGIKNFPVFRDAYAPPRLSGASDTADSVTGFVREPLLSPHDQYLLMLSEQGLLGAGAFVLALGAVQVGLWRRSRAVDGHWLLCVGTTTSITVNFLYSDMGGPTTVLVGIVLGLAARHTWPVASGPASASDSAPAPAPAPAPASGSASVEGAW